MRLRIFMGALALVSATTAFAGDEGKYPSGFLCCNMRTDGRWISDINYQEVGKTGVSVGTPAVVTGYGKYRVFVEFRGLKQVLGNDYSRGTSLDAFARKYIVEQDPLIKISTYPKKTQDAIATGRLLRGMTREQVAMAIGYPITDENPNPLSREWRYWLASNAEYVVKFDDNGLVTDVTSDFDTRARVFID